MTGNNLTMTKSRVCSRCEKEKSLNKDHYQVVKGFKTGFSYYCNLCSDEMKKVGKK